MTKAEKDKYWLDCIQQCRVSGMSDYTWCNQNGSKRQITRLVFSGSLWQN